MTDPVAPGSKPIEPATTVYETLKSEDSPPEDKNAVTPSAAMPIVSNLVSVRRFEFTSGSSNKFWEISLSGNPFTVPFGRLGTAGQSQTKSFADEAMAKHEADHLVAEKLKKGYQEKNALRAHYWLAASALTICEWKNLNQPLEYYRGGNKRRRCRLSRGRK
jgi:predicted DNA-binding WGR domain protein